MRRKPDVLVSHFEAELHSLELWLADFHIRASQAPEAQRRVDFLRGLLAGQTLPPSPTLVPPASLELEEGAP